MDWLNKYCTLPTNFLVGNLSLPAGSLARAEHFIAVIIYVTESNAIADKHHKPI